MKDTDTYAKDVQNDAEYLIAGSPGDEQCLYGTSRKALASRRKISSTDVFIGYKEKKSVLPAGGDFPWAGAVFCPRSFERMTMWQY